MIKGIAAPGWSRRVTAGRPWRLVLAPIMGALGAWTTAVMAAWVVLLIQHGGMGRWSLLDLGATVVWTGLTLLVFGLPLILCMLTIHTVLATLRLTALAAYAGTAVILGLWFTWDLARGHIDCPAGMQGACPDPGWAGGPGMVLAQSAATGLAPMLGAALGFWLVLRPDRPAG